jgi:hypothetical protein
LWRFTTPAKPAPLLVPTTSALALAQHLDLDFVA